MRIEFKAYGGTGSLVGRCFLALLALNACDKVYSPDDKCVIYQMDYDDEPPGASGQNDAYYFKDVCFENYKKLHERGLHFLAPIEVELSRVTLKSVRDYAYPNETEYSLNSLFCRGKNSGAVQELLSAAFTAGSGSSELRLSNAHGCYGDLAVNGFISERIIETNAFKEMHVYDDLRANPQGAIVFYAGSTDGGTANTMIDKDVRSLLHCLKGGNIAVDHSRPFKLYGLRTTPYSKFELVGSESQLAVVSSILRDKFEMSKGVLENINTQNELAAGKQNAGIDDYSYYNLNDGTTDYWLDGLFIAGSDSLDVTAWEAKKDNQFHPTHFTELALAMQAMDAIANRLPNLPQNVPCIYGYNDGGNVDGNRNPVTLQSFFGDRSVSYEYEIYDSQAGGEGAFDLAKYVRAILLTLVAVKSRMVSDFRYPNSAPEYVRDIFRHAENDMDTVCPLIADELEKFLEEAKFIVMALYDAMTYSTFGAGSSPIALMEEEIKYLYSTDTLNNTISMSANDSLSIDDQVPFCKVELRAKTANPQFYVLDMMHTFNYHDGGMFSGKKKKLIGEELYLNFGGGADPRTAALIANNMIQRTFETYLYLM
ncbi:MAG: hypothetical protein K5695_09020 [Oscillospiraceae bacterium]|nr:hypothetical protein [Oscillospiraceae bacterium]